MTVEFKFEIDQMVINPLGTKGIITSASLDNTKIIQYYVETSDKGNWWREDQLMLSK